LIDSLVCRLDRPVQTRLGTVFPWLRLSGAGANVAGYVVRATSTTGTRQAKLLGLSRDATSRVLDCSGYFEPAAGVKADHDGSVHKLDGISKDFLVAEGAIGTAKKVRLRYELTDAAADIPLITGYVGKGTRVANTTQWGAFNWGAAAWADSSLDEWEQMAGQALASSGRVPFVYRVVAAGRFLRFRFQSVNAAAKLALRSFEVDVRKTIKR
jgi:hypothetical protein